MDEGEEGKEEEGKEDHCRDNRLLIMGGNQGSLKKRASSSLC